MAARELRKASLTQDLVNRLNLADHAPAGSRDHIIWDEEKPSFGVRLRPSKAVYVVQYRVGRKQRRESLGDVRKLTLKDARKAAGQRFAKVELGVDPAAEKAVARGRDRVTFRSVADRYLAAKKPDLRPNTWNAAKRYFEDYWGPFHRTPIGEITSRALAAHLAKLVAERGRTGAARARANLSALFTWAMREGLVDSNPTLNTNNPSRGLPERDRVLDNRELRAIWAACRDDDFGRIVKLLLLTGCRRDEIGGLRWSEIEFDGKRIILPGERTKAKRAFLLPLSPMAASVLHECPRKEGREFLFGQWGGSFSRWAWDKLSIDKRIAEAGDKIAAWRLHDLRRTVATRMAEIEVQPHVIEACLNHSHGSKVARTYNRHDYSAEKREALNRWADHLSVILDGARVVPIARTA